MFAVCHKNFVFHTRFVTHVFVAKASTLKILAAIVNATTVLATIVFATIMFAAQVFARQVFTALVFATKLFAAQVFAAQMYVCSTRVFCGVWWRLWRGGGCGVCSAIVFAAIVLAAYYCNAIMFTVIFFSLKVFFWAALVNSGLVWVGLGTSGQSRLSKLAGLHRS